MSISEKIKAINNKIERQTAKISALPSGYVSKCEFLSDKYVLPEKDLLEQDLNFYRSANY